MPKPKQYTVRDIATGEILATGTSRECGEILGKSSRAICKMERGEFKSKKYIVTATKAESEPEEKPEKEIGIGWRQEAANKWDAFAAPLRRKYGIPVYKPEKEDEENA